MKMKKNNKKIKATVKKTKKPVAKKGARKVVTIKKKTYKKVTAKKTVAKKPVAKAKTTKGNSPQRMLQRKERQNRNIAGFNTAYRYAASFGML